MLDDKGKQHTWCFQDALTISLIHDVRSACSFFILEASFEWWIVSSTLSMPAAAHALPASIVSDERLLGRMSDVPVAQ